ncbi:TPA: hypothetical protein ACPPQA_001498 [Haemophilus influenzae]
MKLLNKFLTFAFTAFLTLMLSNGVYAKMDFDKVYKETKQQYGISIDNDEFIPFKNNVGNEKDFVLLKQEITDFVATGEKIKDFIQSKAEVIPYINFLEPIKKFNTQIDNVTYKIFKDGIYNDEIFNLYITALKYNYQFYEFINSIYYNRVEQEIKNGKYSEAFLAETKSKKENFVKELKRKYKEHKAIYLDYFK